ncbi:MAG: CAAX amino protease family protein [uncultured bacterium]|nr:MAG: CAAX amino protease family protein [uncultured bacterium]OGT08629.1 MAG: CAAX protease [Gammaproteobacteria bacterium RBG_16_37_9]HBC71957.1 CPBP family intramembrane metalloprotease domain-containing protein [Coxiellaceae bacterium]HBS52104.1 CPBP family intramembrane metalloprotease domain-containing protein [Coxiellaceae bacterium]HBY56175.1 CPBP family intramembrane metalloprotease domain-containing protein [Coxiellaceae bacterium]
MSKIKYYDRPVLFYFLSTFITWVAWGIAAILSHVYPQNEALCALLLFLGLISPAVVAFTLMYSNNKLRNDFFPRLLQFSNIKPIYIVLAFFLMPLGIVLAQFISLLFGYSTEQFSLSHEPSFTAPLLSVWVVLFLAPVIEEMAWHSYGTDCLRAKFNLFTTCLMFSLFWAIWHLPLSFVKGYYQSNLIEISWLHSLNFSISIFPFVFLMNWLYYKSGRSILLAIIFHMSGNFSSEIFSTHPDTKIIYTILLTLLSAMIICVEKNMFFKKIGETGV